MNYSELAVFIIYLASMLAIGVYFFIHDKGKSGEKEYFLGGRLMWPWVTALSASVAVAGIVAGAATDVIWLAAFSRIGFYEKIIPGFISGLIAALVAALCGKDPCADVKALYDNRSLKRLK
jgi:Na+/proline symporter